MRVGLRWMIGLGLGLGLGAFLVDRSAPSRPALLDRVLHDARHDVGLDLAGLDSVLRLDDERPLEFTDHLQLSDPDQTPAAARFLSPGESVTLSWSLPASDEPLVLVTAFGGSDPHWSVQALDGDRTRIDVPRSESFGLLAAAVVPERGLSNPEIEPLAAAWAGIAPPQRLAAELVPLSSEGARR